MTGRELLIELEKSGTPADVLAVGLEHLHENPSADANSVLRALMAQTDLQARGKGRDRVSPGTLDKAEKIIRAGRWVQPEPSGELEQAQIWLDAQRRASGFVDVKKPLLTVAPEQESPATTATETAPVPEHAKSQPAPARPPQPQGKR